MAESRIERFKEYRRSMISDCSIPGKTTIDTNIKVTSSEEVAHKSTDETLIKNLKRRELRDYLIFGIFTALIFVPIIVFGIILF